MTARGTWLDRLTPTDFSLVRLADGVVVGGAAAPSTELALHVECYRARPDVTAVVHVHPQLSVLLTALGHPIRLLTTDHVAYVREVRVAPYRHPGTPELATEAAALLADGCDCVVLSRHGCSVVADSVEMALRRVLNLEEAAGSPTPRCCSATPPPMVRPAIGSGCGCSVRAGTDRAGRAASVTPAGVARPSGGEGIPRRGLSRSRSGRQRGQQ